MGIVLDENSIHMLSGEHTVYGLARKAIWEKRSLAQILTAQETAKRVDYEELVSAGRILPPIDHPDPARCFVTGTGLTHLGSAKARDEMHVKAGAKAVELEPWISPSTCSPVASSTTNR